MVSSQMVTPLPPKDRSDFEIQTVGVLPDLVSGNDRSQLNSSGHLSPLIPRPAGLAGRPAGLSPAALAWLGVGSLAVGGLHHVYVACMYFT